MPPLFVAIGTWHGPREEIGAMGECVEITEVLTQGGAGPSGHTKSKSRATCSP